MIISRTRVPNSLLIKLSSYNLEQVASRLVNKVGDDALRNVREYGVGTAGGNENPTGGAPYWQGQIKIAGHRRGYLSDSHYIKQINPFNVQIVSNADFVEGVLDGFSTNWRGQGGIPITFPPNYYHKRAVDKLYADGRIPTIWRTVLKGSII